MHEVLNVYFSNNGLNRVCLLNVKDTSMFLFKFYDLFLILMEILALISCLLLLFRDLTDCLISLPCTSPVIPFMWF